MPHPSNYLYALIVGCEAAFWLVLGLALAARYLLQRPALGRALLLSLPAVDLLLLSLTAADLRLGAETTAAHGLATVYVGFTLAFGPLAVRWADQRFADWLAGQPPPVRSTAKRDRVRDELKLWLRCIVAWAITLLLLVGLIALVDDAAATQPLLVWFRIAIGSTIAWFVFGPLWGALFFRQATTDN